MKKKLRAAINRAIFSNDREASHYLENLRYQYQCAAPDMAHDDAQHWGRSTNLFAIREALECLVDEYPEQLQVPQIAARCGLSLAGYIEKVSDDTLTAAITLQDMEYSKFNPHGAPMPEAMTSQFYEGPEYHCSICAEDFQEGDQVVRVECRRCFHSECWDRLYAHEAEEGNSDDDVGQCCPKLHPLSRRGPTSDHATATHSRKVEHQHQHQHRHGFGDLFC